MVANICPLSTVPIKPEILVGLLSLPPNGDEEVLGDWCLKEPNSRVRLEADGPARRNGEAHPLEDGGGDDEYFHAGQTLTEALPLADTKR